MEASRGDSKGNEEEADGSLQKEGMWRYLHDCSCCCCCYLLLVCLVESVG
jgi:hypothetical protein